MGITVQAQDGVYGRSAAGVRARLEQSENGHWRAVAEAETDPEGRVRGWSGRKFDRGAYRLVLDSGRYFVGLGLSAAYPEIALQFRLHDETDACQIHVLISPCSYSAYFGALS
ncbi:hydroxyisourate hydrolase [Sphaerimonospora thailandensis]|uniref:Transthyretin/hydroxyisourate hydrolase domain-containing protein n=1 Tax=Sphaerimonospora thailandensis TaxID=795644 RepID=A0A8J3VXE7_9ACTN|nr:hydroxyisourate hydrolase [Sphaerimonospora thailandensis]GIH67831.1 hypothetical protein Mth01_00840 [Sphaerimonospora thailandensis]